MAGGDHDAAVEVVHPGDVGHGGRGGDVEHIGVRAGGHQAGYQGIFEHIGAAAGVLADDDAGGALLHRAALLCGPGPFFCIIPAEKTADLIGVVCCQIDIRFPTEAVGAEVTGHSSFLLCA